jgi:hypothetical protein
MTLDTDTIFHTLSNARRRCVIAALTDDPEMTVRALTVAVASHEYDCSESELEYEQRKRVYTSLVQTHLPSLHRTGVVEYEKDRGRVTATAALGTFDPYVDDGASVDRAWSRRLFSMTAIFAALSALLAFDAPVVDALSATGVALGATLGLGLLAGSYARRVHVRRVRGTASADGTAGRFASSKSLLSFWR